MEALRSVRKGGIMTGPYNNHVFVADGPLSSLKRSIAEQKAYIRRARQSRNEVRRRAHPHNC